MSPAENGRYSFDGRIATGGMGEVWRATDQVLGREVAVKVLKPEYADDPTFRSRFETEARNAAALHHPNVASVFDFGELPPDGSGTPRPYLVMELVRGQPLSALLRGGEPMPAETAATLAAQAADGLAAAHALGIVHRDIKPANLLVTPDRTVKITDFGIARAADAVALTQTGQVIGTPQYLSPEQAEGKPATFASDVYSLGVVLYECLAGRRPFDADSPVATALAHLRQPPPPLPDGVPEPLRRTVEVALAKDPQARFASVRDLAGALRGGAVVPGPGATAVGGAVGPDDDESDAPTRVDRSAPLAGAAGAGAGAAAAAAAAQRPGAARDAAWDDDPRFATRAGDTRDGEPVTPAPPPGDDDRGGRRGLPPWLPWVLVAAAVLAVIVLLTRLGGNDEQQPQDPGPSDTPSASSSASETPSSQQPSSASPSPSPETVQVTASDYLGKPEAAARGQLERLGLQVTDTQVDNPGDQREGTVADVNPSGTVRKGSTVTLSVYGAPQPTETPTTPSTSSSPSASDSPTQGGGNGNGNGNGNGGKGKGQ